MTVEPTGRHRPRRKPGAVLVALVVVTALTGCGAGPVDDDRSDHDALPTIRSLDDIHLPLDHYAMSRRDKVVLATVHEELVSQCMVEKGFRDHPVADWSHRLDLPEHALSGFPLVDLDDAREHGFTAGWAVGFEEADSRAFTEPFAGWNGDEVTLALFGTAEPRSGDLTTEELEAVPATGGGCDAEARRRLFGFVDEEPVGGYWFDTLAGSAITEASEDRRLKEPKRAWAACMRQRGFAYSETHEVQEDPRWLDDLDGARDAAVAQVECTHESRLVDTWVAVATEHQEELIEENAERLEQYRDTRQAMLAAVRERGLGNVGPHEGG